jgi:hypothetical protein
VAVTVIGSTPLLDALVERLGGAGESARVATLREVDAAERSTASATTLVHHVVGRIPPELAGLPQNVAERLVLFVDQVTAETEADLLAFHTTLLGMIVRQGALAVEEMEIAVRKAVDSATAGPATAGLGLYLAGGELAPKMMLSRSNDRGIALAALESFVRVIGLEARRFAQIVTVADELITNAFHHAPTDGMGGHPYSHVSRMDIIQAGYNRDVQLMFGRNAQRVGVAVRDCYGSLEQSPLRSHLAKAATNPTANYRVSGGTGGAKLGLVTALRSSSQLIFDVVPGASTEVIGLVDTTGTHRQFVEGGKTLQLFSLPPPRRR